MVTARCTNVDCHNRNFIDVDRWKKDFSTEIMTASIRVKNAIHHQLAIKCELADRAEKQKLEQLLLPAYPVTLVRIIMRIYIKIGFYTAKSVNVNSFHTFYVEPKIWNQKVLCFDLRIFQNYRSVETHGMGWNEIAETQFASCKQSRQKGQQHTTIPEAVNKLPKVFSFVWNEIEIESDSHKGCDVFYSRRKSAQ